MKSEETINNNFNKYYKTNKEIITEIWSKQQVHDEKIKKNEMNFELQKQELDHIKQNLSKSNILKWNFTAVVIGNVIVFILQQLF